MFIPHRLVSVVWLVLVHEIIKKRIRKNMFERKFNKSRKTHRCFVRSKFDFYYKKHTLNAVKKHRVEMKIAFSVIVLLFHHSPRVKKREKNTFARQLSNQTYLDENRNKQKTYALEQYGLLFDKTI